MGSPYENPYDSGPWWPVILLPFTKNGRAVLDEALFGGARALLGIEDSPPPPPPPPPDDIQYAHCCVCPCKVIRNWRCEGCRSRVDAIIFCPRCQADTGVANESSYAFVCKGCGLNVY